MNTTGAPVVARLATPLLLLAFAAPALAVEPVPAAWRHTELRRFAAAEANQGVAVDGQFFYAITNQAIGKYRKDDGRRVDGWQGAKNGPFHHLNAGMVRDGRLYAAHSNFPNIPMVSSVEIWDTATMQHVGSHSFGIDVGSLTWIDYRDNHWYACFAHYAKDKPRTGRDPAWTEVVQFDDQWRRTAGWVFPSGLLERFGGASCSGGAFGPAGLLFATGHDARELYVLDFPAAGSVLEWKGTVSISAEGQAFAWDPAEAGVLYSIARRSHEVIVSQIAAETATPAEAPATPPTTLTPAEQQLGFELLFDGQSCADWEHAGNWCVEEGALKRKAKGGDITYTRKKVPDDFELRFDYKVVEGCNSGVYYRPGQYEYQVLDNAHSPYGENPRQSSAALYFCMAPAKDATRPAGQWNECRIVCKGTVIQHWLNGEKVVDFDYTDPRWAADVERLRLRGGELSARGANLRLQDHGDTVWFRQLRWRAIPAGETLERAEFTPMPIPPAALEKEQQRLEQMRAKTERHSAKQ